MYPVRVITFLRSSTHRDLYIRLAGVPLYVCYVYDVTKGSPAHLAGLEQYDLILSIRDSDHLNAKFGPSVAVTTNIAEIDNIISSGAEGSPLEITYRRGNNGPIKTVRIYRRFYQ